MILVTGATGLIGFHIAQALRKQGLTVRALVRPGSRAALLDSLGIELVQGDLLAPSSLAQAVEGVGAVFHAAARVVVQGRRREVLAINFQGTQDLARAALAAGAGRFVFLSSVSVYGGGGEGEISESQAYQASGPYSESKILAERALLDMHRRGELDVRILRPCLVYGPHDRNFVPSLLRLLRVPIIPLLDGGRALTSVVHARDVAQAALLAWRSEAAAGEAFNVTDGSPLPWRELLHRVARAAGFRPLMIPIPGRPAVLLAAALHPAARLAGPRAASIVHPRSVRTALRDRVYSTGKAREVLDYAPQVGLEEGLAEAIAWRRNHPVAVG